MRLLPAYFLMFLLFAGISELCGQSAQVITSSARAGREYTKAFRAFTAQDYLIAIRHASKAIKTDPKLSEAYLLTADAYSEIKLYDSAIRYYELAILSKPDALTEVNRILGRLNFSSGRYDKSVSSFGEYLRHHPTATDYHQVKQLMDRSERAQKLKANPVPFEPVNLGNLVNTPDDEYVNAISVDGNTLIFTLKTPIAASNGRRNYREEFYYTDKVNGSWDKAKVFPLDAARAGSEGALSVSPDGRYLFLTSCHQPDGFGSCDLYYSVKENGYWANPMNLGRPVNTSRWESQPSLSSDGKTLFFASNRSGGFGGSDIWKTELQADGSWSTPENLGPQINTKEDEMSPFIHYDGRTLYFSSRGLPGMGGADLFVTTLQPNGQWNEPENIGYPINTYADEIGLTVSSQGDFAFISASRSDGYGGYDIYSFRLPEAVRPLPVSYIKGTVRSIKTLAPLQASLDLIDLEAGKVMVHTFSEDRRGEFLVVLPTGKRYALHANRLGYMFYSEHFSPDSVTLYQKPYQLDVLMRPIEVGQIEVLKNIFFAHDSYELQPESGPELTRLVRMLNETPLIKAEIIGHTDNTGKSDYNQQLSEKRAKAVYDYLVSRGIDQKRLKHSGMGDALPIESNATPEGRAANRRTEFKITN